MTEELKEKIAQHLCPGWSIRDESIRNDYRRKADKILALLHETGWLPREEVKRMLEAANAILDDLEKTGWVQLAEDQTRPEVDAHIYAEDTEGMRMGQERLVQLGWRKVVK